MQQTINPTLIRGYSKNLIISSGLPRDEEGLKDCSDYEMNHWGIFVQELFFLFFLTAKKIMDYDFLWNIENALEVLGLAS